MIEINCHQNGEVMASLMPIMKTVPVSIHAKIFEL